MGGRLGKIKDRKQQRSLFKSNPLHLACSRGDPSLVRTLLSKGCKANVPNASGLFPIHLACSRSEETGDSGEEDLHRLECVRLLLSSTPIAIKDGNKQTILHSAARSGHCELLKQIMVMWKAATETTGIKFKSHNNVPGRIYDWYDVLRENLTKTSCVLTGSVRPLITGLIVGFGRLFTGPCSTDECSRSGSCSTGAAAPSPPSQKQGYRNVRLAS